MSFVDQLTLVAEHGYCVLGTLAILPINLFAISRVLAARKKYNVSTPTLYLPAEHKHANAYNCVQRAHQQFLEQLPFHLTAAACGSIYRPGLAAILIGIRSIGFLVSMYGYTSKKQSNRKYGAFGILALFGLYGLSFEVGVRLLLDN